MSAALGNYIHLHFKNYIDYGVLRKRKKKMSIPNYDKYIENRFKAAKEIDENTLTLLRKRIKLNTQAEKDKRANEFERKRQQELINQIYALLYERSKVIGSASRVRQVAQGHSDNNVNQGVWYAVKDSVTGAVTNHQYGQYGANWSTSITHADLKRRSDKANRIFKNIQKLITEINNGKRKSQKDIKRLADLYEQYSHLSFDLESLTGADVQCVAKAIEDAAKALRYQNVIQHIGGGFGEMIISLADDTCQTLATTQVAKHIQEHVIGSQRTAALLDKSLIHNYGDKIFDTSTEDGTKYHIGTTQDKVDVQITVGGTPIYVNVKSQAVDNVYSPQLQEVNLLVALTFLNQYENFSNHWLNLHVANAYSMDKERDDLDIILKKEVAYQALVSGDPFKKDVPQSDTFAYINRLTGQVYIQSTRKILENLDNFGGLNRISSLRFQNEERTQIWQRINDILHAVHGINLYVTLKGSIIDAGSRSS